MNKKIIVAAFAGLLVVSFANISIVNCDDVSGYFKYKIVCKAPTPIIFEYDTDHSATTTITEAKIDPNLTLYHTVVRAELRYNSNGTTKTVVNTSKHNSLVGTTKDDNSITVKKKINHKNFKNTYHDMTLGGVGKNYSAKYTFTSPQTIKGTRKIP
ncbi:MAG: hypothetical protein IKZ42_08435 [Clostridiales bacterium]|nr:hypothetical protein [Clostridiales bacterium]